MQITSDILRESPPSTTPWASRLALLDLLAIAHAAAASGNAARGGHARHIRLEISAGVSYLRSLERELDEANGAAGRLDPAEVSTRVDVLSARLREHVVRVLADAAAFAKEEDLDGADTDAGAGANENAAPSNADSVNYGTTSNNIAAVDPTDDGSAWLARAAANRAGRAFREPLAAAAIDALGDMEDGDAESFARAIRDALPSATTLIAVGRAPMSGALARLFGGALKRRLGPTLRGEKTAVEKKKEAARRRRRRRLKRRLSRRRRTLPPRPNRAPRRSRNPNRRRRNPNRRRHRRRRKKTSRDDARALRSTATSVQPTKLQPLPTDGLSSPSLLT